MTHGVFRLAYALVEAGTEGRVLSSSAFRMPLVGETSERISPPTRVRGRSPERDLQGTTPDASPTPPRPRSSPQGRSGVRIVTEPIR